ncbi:MAG TPA: hypothetical protein VIS06_11235 [Mycobacteriales bacterium]
MIDRNDGTDPANAMLFLAASMGPGGSDRAIAEQEHAGQAQLVHSDRLPTKLNSCTQADFEDLGFTFGDPDPADPLFRPVTLPDGWRREASDHDMWSYIVDTLGRRRVAVFYKAAFYDRRAHASIKTVGGYLEECLYYGRKVVSDDTWATPTTLVVAAQKGIAEKEEQIRVWSGNDGEPRWVAEAEADRDKYAAVVARFDV